MNIKMKNAGLSIGDFIKRVRTAKNLSQGEVAKKADLARSYISRIEEGEYKSPSVMTLLRLAKGLGISNENIFSVAGATIREGKYPEFDVYCRTKLGLPEEAIKEMQRYLELLKLNYANSKKQQTGINSRGEGEG